MSELSDSHSAEAINAVAVAQEAVEKARNAQLSSALKVHQEDTLDIFVKAMRRVLTEGEEGSGGLLIKRIPFICNDIVWIKRLLWTLITANGAVVFLLITLAIQRAFT